MALSDLILPKGYKSKLDLRETQQGIKVVKDNFQQFLAVALNLERVSAPLIVTRDSGLNDDLNGIERPVSFDVPDAGKDLQIVHSLAKWKRYALKQYGFSVGKGIYTDMNAIRRDELLDNLHSVYVDQWDWEKVIRKEDRTEEFLKATVKEIYTAIKQAAKMVCWKFPQLSLDLASDIFFITSQELLDMYPGKSPKERENEICKKHGAVFVMQIGGLLSDGKKHDGRAPDYDDWDLNGDILVWNDVLGRAFELSSMGIRVSPESLKKQLKEAGCEEREKLPFHKALLAGELPYTIGGGIGQSRLCMLLLNKAHIGEVQSAAWSDEMIDICRKNNIFLL